jgi:rSAM/selenodomain-associated transferase 1
MVKERLLLLFVKNPVAGKVKTRLARTVGEARALQVYKRLVHLTEKSAKRVDSARQVWYSSFIDQNDLFDESTFEKRLQVGDDLGERMRNAFSKSFEEGYREVVIIGSDCPDLNSDIIEQAFDELEKSDVVIGPSADGGYYLLGMNTFIDEIFEGVQWSSSEVLSQTKEKLNRSGYAFKELQVLNDIDTEDDLNNSTLDYV